MSILQSNGHGIGRRTGQSSIEFLVMVSFTLLIFTAFYAFFADRQVAVAQQQEQKAARSVADKVAFELDLALTQGDGFQRTFTLPDTIAGSSYTVTVTNGLVLVEYEDHDLVSSTAARSITGDIETGENTVRNEEGALYVSQP